MRPGDRFLKGEFNSIIAKDIITLQLMVALIFQGKVER